MDAPQCGHRSLEKGRRGTGDFNLVSTSSNLKGRGAEWGCRNEDQGRGTTLNYEEQTGKRENLPLDWSRK